MSSSYSAPRTISKYREDPPPSIDKYHEEDRKASGSRHRSYKLDSYKSKPRSPSIREEEYYSSSHIKYTEKDSQYSPRSPYYNNKYREEDYSSSRRRSSSKSKYDIYDYDIKYNRGGERHYYSSKYDKEKRPSDDEYDYRNRPHHHHRSRSRSRRRYEEHRDYDDSYSNGHYSDWSRSRSRSKDRRRYKRREKYPPSRYDERDTFSSSMHRRTSIEPDYQDSLRTNMKVRKYSRSPSIPPPPPPPSSSQPLYNSSVKAKELTTNMERIKSTTKDQYHHDSKTKAKDETITSSLMKPLTEAEKKNTQLLLQSMSTLNIKTISDYEKLSQIGEGTYGKVYKGRHRETGQLVALKKVRMETEKEGFPITATREIKILKSLCHKNIVKLIEMVTSKASVYLVFEYMEYDLSALLSFSNTETWNLGFIKFLLKELLEALYYLHKKNILHRDIKGSNLLLNKKGELKLADFGLARNFSRAVPRHLTNRVITLWYRPPELLLGSSEYGKDVDVWGIGCLFLEWLYKSPPFQGTNEISQLDSIYKVTGTPSFYHDPSTTKDYPILSSCPWSQWIKPRDVYQDTLDEALGRLGLSKCGIDLARKFLALEPSKRISCEDALKHSFFTESPLPSQTTDLSKIEGDWHEYEMKLQKKKPSINSFPSTGGGTGGEPKSSSSIQHQQHRSIPANTKQMQDLSIQKTQ